jgi:excisionase family DNA binding protein
MPEMTIRQAARALGTSVDTIRRRIRRGELSYRRDSRGWIMVDVPDAQGGASPMQPSARAGGEPTADLVQRLIEENRWLRDQLDRAAEERAEMRRLLAGAMHQLPAPADQSEPATEMPRSGPETPVTPPKPAPWWQRLWKR